MDGVAELLSDLNVLRSESLIQYITGLTICSVAPFKAVFMARLTDLTFLDATGDVTLSSMSSPEVLAKMNEISTAGKAIYNHLHLGISGTFLARLHIPAGILRIPVFSVPIACFSQESQFLFHSNLVYRNKKEQKPSQ